MNHKFSIFLAAFLVTFGTASVSSIHAADKPASTASQEKTAPKSVAQDLDYGEMYVIQKHEAPEHPWETSVSYSYGFSNPYYGLHSFGLGFHRQIGHFVLAGVSGSYIATNDNDLTSKMEEELRVQTTNLKVYRPKNNAYVNIGVMPLSGLLNFFGTKAMNFDLLLGFGGGFAGYVGETRLLPSLKIFVMPKLMIDSHFGFGAGLSSSYDRFSASDWQNRVEASLNFLARF